MALAITCLLYVALLLGLCLLVSACHASRIYRVTFTDGSYDYYELNYRPATDATSIDYNGETILGVQKIERLKN